MNIETLERRLEGLYLLARMYWRQGRIRDARRVETVITAYEQAWNEWGDEVVRA